MTPREQCEGTPPMRLPEPNLKTKLREAISWLFENDARWPSTMRRPTREEATKIAELAIVSVAAFADWVTAKMEIEVEKVMLTPNQPTPSGSQNEMKPLRKLTPEQQTKIDELAMYFFEGSGDVQAVSWSLRNVILARFEWVAKHGKDSGE